MNFDREKARRALDTPVTASNWARAREAQLDALEACVTPDPYWTEDPMAGVITRTKERADAAEDKLARIRALCDKAIRRSEESPSRTFYGEPFPALLSADEVRAILEGD